MLAGRDIVGKEGLRTVRTRTFKDWKDEDICGLFFYPRVFTAVTWLTGARLLEGEVLSRH